MRCREKWSAKPKRFDDRRKGDKSQDLFSTEYLPKKRMKEENVLVMVLSKEASNIIREKGTEEDTTQMNQTKPNTPTPFKTTEPSKSIKIPIWPSIFLKRGVLNKRDGF